MLKLKVFLVLFVSIVTQSEAASQYERETSKGIDFDPCNARYASEEFPGSIVLCAPVTKANNRKSSTPIYENPLFIPVSRKSQAAPKASNKPSSFAATQHEITNKDAEYTIYPKYSYNYGVVDGNTGDSKAAWEERDGDTVRGEYSVVEADGTIRTVAYTADDRNGFNAVVTRTKPSRVTAESAIVQAFLPFPFYRRTRHRSSH